MRVLKYESFLETMQFAALSNAQRLAKEEEDRRKKKQEQEKTDSSKVNTHDNFRTNLGMEQEEEEMEEIEGQGEMEDMEGEESVEK
jgi:hypothetical protein